MLETLFSLFLLSTGVDPLDSALESAEPPASVRAAFVAELTDGDAIRVVEYDPRRPMVERFELLSSIGESEELDIAVNDWAKDVAPDGRLFADDLRASMGSIVEVEDLGQAWRVHFTHQPSDNDGPVDVWAAKHLSGVAWIEPTSDQIIRVDYSAPHPFDNPGGGEITSYEQSYLMTQEPKYGISLVAAYQIRVEGNYLLSTIRRGYNVQLKAVDVFFASKDEERLFLSNQQNSDPYAQDASFVSH